MNPEIHAGNQLQRLIFIFVSSALFLVFIAELQIYVVCFLLFLLGIIIIYCHFPFFHVTPGLAFIV